MQRDEQLEKKLRQLKDAYETQPVFTDAEQLVSKLVYEKKRIKRKKIKLIFPGFAAVMVMAIAGMLIFVSPEFLYSPQDAKQYKMFGQPNAEMDSDSELTGELKGVQRAPMKTDSILIEGNPETITYYLAAHEQLRVSTYYPEDMLVEMTENQLIFTANFGGVKEEEAYVEIYAMTAAEHDEAMSDFYGKYRIVEKQKEEFTVAHSEQEYMIETDHMIGTVSIFNRNDALFRITIHFPVEYGDGFSPRAEKIVSELQFH